MSGQQYNVAASASIVPVSEHCITTLLTTLTTPVMSSLCSLYDDLKKFFPLLGISVTTLILSFSTLHMLSFSDPVSSIDLCLKRAQIYISQRRALKSNKSFNKETD